MFCFESQSKSCSVVWAPRTIQSMEFSRPEHLSGQLFLSPGDLPNPGIEPRSPTLQQILYQLSHQGSPRILEWVAYPSQQIFHTQELNRGLLHCRWILPQLNYQGNSALILLFSLQSLI